MAGKGLTAREALAASIDLARLVDRRGFTRYWVAEHHSSLGVTTSSPAMLLARLVGEPGKGDRSEEHTSELQSLMRISYAVFCLKKKKTPNIILYIFNFFS